jgi:SAM-dependent methyltransferase
LNFNDRFYADIFAQSGKDYHQAMLLCPEAREAEFLAVVESLKLAQGQKVLDLPAGGGYLRNYLPEHIDYTGLDFAASFSPDIDIEKCAETQLNLPSGLFDHVVCIAALHHIENRAGFFRETKRVLKPKGRFLIADVLTGSPQDRFLNGFVNQWNSLGHNGVFLTPHTETRLLETLGFACSLYTKSFLWKFPSEIAAHEFIRLLFHLDLAPSAAELNDQLNILGITRDHQCLTLPWSLTFIEAEAV